MTAWSNQHPSETERRRTHRGSRGRSLRLTLALAVASSPLGPVAAAPAGRGGAEPARFVRMAGWPSFRTEPRGSTDGPEAGQRRSQSALDRVDPGMRRAVATALESMPLHFVENRGQVPGRVSFYLQGATTTVSFTRDAVVYGLTTAGGRGAVRGHAIRVAFEGANAEVELSGEDRTGAAFSYFSGPRDAWKTGAPSYRRIAYRGLWSGIDLEYGGSEGGFPKYTYVVHPGADPARIVLSYEGASGVRRTDEGRLEVRTPVADLVEDRPYVYQEVDGRRVEVESEYRVLAASQSGAPVRVGYRIGRYDETRPLYVDPAVLRYCGFLGGGGGSTYDIVKAIAVTAQGEVFVIGETSSAAATFPETPGAFDTVFNGAYDVFAARVKVNPSDATAENNLVYCTFIGGSGSDNAGAIAVDGSNNAYLLGDTWSNADFPTNLGPDTSWNGGTSDAFITKLNPTGTALVYSGFLGGSGNEYAGAAEEPAGIAVDAAGSVYVVGYTTSTAATFPDKVGPSTTHSGAEDAFVAKLVPNPTDPTPENNYVYCGYVGGSGTDYGRALAIDAAGNAYVGGSTNSTQATFPESVGPDLTQNGGWDAFVAKVSADGTTLVYCGFLGGSSWDFVTSLAVVPNGPSAGVLLVGGYTSSAPATFPDKVGPDTSFNGGTYDGFVARMNAVPGDATPENNYVYVGYVGGNGDDYLRGVALDELNDAYLAGYTDSTDLPTVAGPDATWNGGLYDGFVAKLKTNPSDATPVNNYVYSGYLGGSLEDRVLGLAVRGFDAHLGGYTYSTQATAPTPFPVVVGPDLTFNGGNTDGFVARIVDDSAPSGNSLVKTGKYTGDTGDDRPIFVGFQPDIVFVKRTGADPQAYAVLRTSSMSGDNTKSLEHNPPLALAPDQIQSLTATGFTIGTDVAVNEAGTEYHWVAFRAGAGALKVDSYVGDGNPTRSISGVGFQPECVIVLPPVGGFPDGLPVITSSTFGADTTFDFDAWMHGANIIRALQPDGFEVGIGGVAPSRPDLNASGRTYHYIAWNAVPGRMAVGTYTGNDADDRNLDVVGFYPEWVLIKKWPNGSLNRPWTTKPASTGVGTDAAYRFSDNSTGALISDAIQALRPLGFQVGTTDRVNSGTDCGGGPCTYHWIAFGPYPPQTNLRSIGTRAHYGTTETDGNGSSLTVTHGSPTVTCSGTCQWRTFNRGRGDVILIDDGGPVVPYTVAALLSESQLMLTTPYDGTSAGGRSYSIRRQHTTILSWFQCISNQFACAYFDAPTSSLVADHRREIGIAYDDSVFVHAARVDLNGSTTDPTHDIVLTADPGNRHNGTTNTGVKVTGPAGSAAFLVRDNDVTIEWLEIEGGARALDIQTPFTGTGHLVLRNNLLHDFTADAVLFIGGNNADIYNNFIYQVGQDGIDLGGFSSKARILNNTFVSCGWGITGCTNPDALLRNNVAVANSAGDIGCTGRDPASSHNLTSSISEGPTNSPAGGGIGGALASDSPTVCGGSCVGFVSLTSGSEDLHLLATSYPNLARDAGAGLSTLFATDIDGGVRTGTWDIGADEFGVTTAVKLSSFAAAGLDSAVAISWRTASELDNLGFYLYRAPSADGPWTRLTSSLVPGLGSSALGQSYAFTDRGLVNGTRYHYRLEDVDASSKVTSHGPVSAVPQAGAAAAGEPRKDGVRDGKKVASGPGCPAWVLTAYGSAAGSDASASSLSCTRHGDPEATSFTELSRDGRSVTAELRTGGFYALDDGHGAARVYVPGFDVPRQEAAVALPLRRALVEAVVGRRVALGGVRALEIESLRGLVPAGLGATEMQVGRDGTVRPGRRRERDVESAARLRRTPTGAVGGGPAAAPPVSELVRLLPSQFQGETKSAVLELQPLRWDAQRRRLLLAKRVLVKLLFAGREAGESGRGNAGRAPGRRQPAATGEVLARLYTTQAGLHEATFEELFAARRRGVSSSELRLERQGEAVAFHVEPRSGTFGPGSRLYFHAERGASATDFSGEVAYELRSAREGVRMGAASAAPGSAAVGSDPVVTRRYETNRFYQPGLLDAVDPWLWEAVSSGATRAVSFALAGVSASGPAELEIDLQGASESGQAVDHHVSVSVNGVPVGEAQFAGKRPHRVSLSLPASLLREGPNELQLTNVADTGVTSLVFLDRFTLVHPRRSSAAGGRFEGTWLEGGTATVSGVSGASAVVELASAGGAPGASLIPRWLHGFVASGDAVSFQAEAGRAYLVVSQPLAPRVSLPESSSVRATTNQADYLLIAPRAFLAAAEPLISRRQDQGLAAKAVPFEEIAAEFGHGQPSAEAIRGFLSYAFHSWGRPSPRYVVLLGDASSDPRNFSGVSQPSPLPVLWTKTSYLWTASDPLLGAVNGEDALPDLAIGRLPATTAQQAEALVAKLLAWEDSGQGLSGAATLVADNPDLAGDFEADVADIRASFLAGRETRVLKVGELGALTRPSVQQALDSGLSYLGYVGHGGAAVWASENVWNTWDAESLQAQSRQPLLVTMNCLNGYFVAPSYESLSESLVKAEGRGAIAAFSPSGLSLDGPAHQYHRALMAELTSGRHERLGDALLAAQRTYAQTGLMPELLSVYHLLGDPATRVR